MPAMGPYVRFSLQVLVFAAVGVTQGTLHLTHMIPPGWIDTVTAYFGWIAVIGTAITTGMSGLSLTTANRVASAQSLPDDAKVQLAQSLPSDRKISIAAAAPEVSQIVTTRAIAQAAGPTGDGAKVVSIP
jgi:hypothetical protein